MRVMFIEVEHIYRNVGVDISFGTTSTPYNPLNPQTRWSKLNKNLALKRLMSVRRFVFENRR